MLRPFLLLILLTVTGDLLLPTSVSAQVSRLEHAIAVAPTAAESPTAAAPAPSPVERPATISLKGRVLDETGHPIPGAITTLMNVPAAAGTASMVVSDGEGWFIFTLPADVEGIELQCSYLGFTGQTLTVAPGSTDAATFTLQKLRQGGGDGGGRGRR